MPSPLRQPLATLCASTISSLRFSTASLPGHGPDALDDLVPPLIVAHALRSRPKEMSRFRMRILITEPARSRQVGECLEALAVQLGAPFRRWCGRSRQPSRKCELVPHDARQGDVLD